MKIDPKDYINDYKSILIYPDAYPDKFTLLYKLVKNRLECNENSLFKLQQGLFFSFYISDVHNLYIHKNWPLFSIDEYTHLINLYLELIGFKKYVKDYTLLSSYSFSISSNKISTTIQKIQSIRLNFNVLFDKPDFSNIKDIDLENDYFNEKLFIIQKDDHFLGNYDWNRITEFSDCFFYNLFRSVEEQRFFINNSLSLDNLEKVRQETLIYLKAFYAEKNEPIFSGLYSSESLQGYTYYNEKDVLSGIYGNERKLFWNISFFRFRIPWINFALGWENRLFRDTNIISSELSITFNGNCKYLLENRG
jgi:hypothetical protein